MADLLKRVRADRPFERLPVPDRSPDALHDHLMGPGRQAAGVMEAVDSADQLGARYLGQVFIIKKQITRPIETRPAQDGQDLCYPARPLCFIALVPPIS